MKSPGQDDQGLLCSKLEHYFTDPAIYIWSHCKRQQDQSFSKLIPYRFLANLTKSDLMVHFNRKTIYSHNNNVMNINYPIFFTTLAPENG